jgi:heme-degrading monooxygenase HmoA
MDPMTLEYVTIDVTPGAEEKFCLAFRANSAALDGAAGLRSVALSRCVEHESRFLLCVEWDTIAAHEEFRATEEFAGWRAAVGPFFAVPPQAAHYEAVESGPGDSAA